MNEYLGESMDELLHERARAVERWARMVLAKEADADDVRLALVALRGTFTAHAHNTGHEPIDANGRLWAERADALERMVRTARDGRVLRKVLRVVIGDMRPLTGSERLEEALS